jgi:hypothetical protein
MPAYYNVEVFEISGNTLKLNVWLKHPEREYFSLKKNFALQFIIDPILQELCEANKILLKGEVNDFYEEDWIMDNEEELIEEVKIETERYPVADHSNLTPEEKSAFWKNKNRIPFAQYIITVSNENTLAHIETGMSWESAAYEI